jgi:hypothetical protein
LNFEAGREAWRRVGRVEVHGLPAWAHTHVALPVVETGPDGAMMAYFSSRDAEGCSRIGRGALTLDTSGGRLDVETAPVLDLGTLGAFDDSGVTSSCVVASGDERYLYYTGWTRGVTVPFYLYAGLAVSTDGGATFARVSRGPVLERNAVDPYLTASPWVLIDGGIWRMWYVSCVRWERVGGEARHYYHVRYAESRDGISWARTGHVCLDFASAGEYAFGRPCVVRTDEGRYRMWYSYRGDHYRIGYAESGDGLDWTRRDAEGGLDTAQEGWDAEMVEYPAVFGRAGTWHMLYNGNGYGRTGIGVARWAAGGTSAA